MPNPAQAVVSLSRPSSLPLRPILSIIPPLRTIASPHASPTKSSLSQHSDSLTSLTAEQKQCILSILSTTAAQAILPLSSSAQSSDSELLQLWQLCDGDEDVLRVQIAALQRRASRCETTASLLRQLQAVRRSRRLPSICDAGCGSMTPPLHPAADTADPWHSQSSSPLPQSPADAGRKGSQTRLSFAHYLPPLVSSCPASPNPLIPSPLARSRAQSEALPVGRQRADSDALEPVVTALNSVWPPLLAPPELITAADLQPLLALSTPSALLDIVTMAFPPSACPPASSSAPFPPSTHFPSVSALLGSLHRRATRDRLLTLLSYPHCLLFSRSATRVQLTAGQIEELLTLGLAVVEREVRRLEGRGVRCQGGVDELITRVKQSIATQQETPQQETAAIAEEAEEPQQT